MTVTWLHISDFHFKVGDPYDRDVVLNALVRSVGLEASQGWQPDIIIATGDVAQSGLPDEYEPATAFFNALLTAAKLDRSRLFVICGNHDVNRTAAKGLQRSLTSEAESMDFFGPDHPQHHFAKLTAFRDWYQGYFGTIRQLRSRTTCETIETIEVRGVRVTLLGINSALFCLDDHDYGQLWVGRRCVDAAIEQIRKEDGDINVALIHHPLEWLHDAERRHIKEKLHGAVDVILRGHLHESEIEKVSTVDGGALHMAAGASYQTRLYTNLALMVRADAARGELKVRPLRYGDATERWTLDTDLFNTPDYYGNFSVAWKSLRRHTSGPPVETSVATAKTASFLLGTAGMEAKAHLGVATCVVVEDDATFIARLDTARRVMLQDPSFRGAPDIRAVLSGGRLPFDSADPVMKMRLLSLLAELTFEAYVCYGDKAGLARKSKGDVAEVLIGRLLFERVQARRNENIHLVLDPSLANWNQRVGSVLGGIVQQLSQGKRRDTIMTPTVQETPNRPRNGIADYVSWIVERRLAEPSSGDARGFDQLHPKIRVMHDYVNDVFYTSQHPFKG